MKLTPMEAESWEFARRIRGYDPVEVDAFKRLVAMRLQELLHEAAALREQVSGMQEDLRGLKEREQGIQETLAVAKRFSDDLRTQARREADILRVEAELEAEGIRREAESSVYRLQRDVVEIKAQRARLIVQLRGLIEGQGQVLDIYEAAAREEELPVVEPTDAPPSGSRQAEPSTSSDHGQPLPPEAATEQTPTPSSVLELISISGEEGEGVAGEPEPGAS